ncbi:hypothetical protein ACKWTF_000676 [Chironomus riparius]
MSDTILYFIAFIVTSFVMVLKCIIVAQKRTNRQARQLNTTNPTISSSYTYDPSTHSPPFPSTHVHSHTHNAVTPSAPQSISTIYTSDFSRQNNELPTYTEIFIDDLPAYHQVVNETAVHSRN